MSILDKIIAPIDKALERFDPVKQAEKGQMYRVVEPFTNWTTRKKYAKGDRVSITPSEMPGFQDALDKGKLRKS